MDQWTRLETSRVTVKNPPKRLFGHFGQTSTGPGKRVRQSLDRFQHQLQLVFAVVARIVLTAAMAGDRVVYFFFDLRIAPVGLGIVSEAMVRLVAQLWRRIF